MYAYKSIRQDLYPNQELLTMMETFREMVNHCIRIGLENNVSTLKKLSLLSYNDLGGYNTMSYYKLTAISQASARLSQMKRSIKKGIKCRSPFVSKPYLVSCYGFKVNGMLLSFPVSSHTFINIPLNHHTQKTLSDKSLKVKSFVVTPES